LPDNDPLLSQLLLIYDGRDLQELVNGEFQRMRILLNVNVHGANAIQAVIDKIDALVAEVDDPDSPGRRRATGACSPTRRTCSSSASCTAFWVPSGRSS